MNFKKILEIIGAPKIMAASSALLILILMVILLAFLAASGRTQDNLNITGNAAANFRVFYLENEFFNENPVPNDLGFLMSFTDFIEIESVFNMQLDEETEIFYNYEAIQHLIIRYMGSINGVSNPIVYRLSQPLGSHQGQIFAESLSLPANTHTIFPKNYTNHYLKFISTQRQFMFEENVIARDLRGFSAEILIDFSYNIFMPAHNLNETASTGLRFQITTEVFQVSPAGDAASAFSRAIPIGSPPPQLSLPSAMAFVAAFGLGALGLFKSLQNMQAHPNPRHRQALQILKKYSNEIATSTMPLPLTSLNLMPVENFEILLRLSINLNKHIMCHHNDKKAEFAVVVEHNAYYFKINYENTPQNTPTPVY